MLGTVKLTRDVIKRKFIYNSYGTALDRAGSWSFSLDKCNGSCNILGYLSDILSVPNKTKDVNVEVFYMITGFNESKSLIKHISCKRRYRVDGKKYNSKQIWNSHKF